MLKMVRFRTSDGVFLAPVENVLEVRRAGELSKLPGPKPGVAGLIESNGQALTVLSTFGSGGSHIVLFSSGANKFGLLAEEVSGVVNVSELDVEPAPAGQSRSLVAGVVKSRSGLELMVAVDALWRELQRPA